MRTIFLTFIVALTSTLTFAQTSEHLLFKGVPVDGTLNEYVSKMKQSGFTHILTDDGTAILNGDFAGYKDCHVGVSTLKQKDLVYKIGVLFPKQETWSRLSANYFDLKEMLTEKYGKPSDKVEKFDGYSQPEDDFVKMLQVELDRCKFYSVWKTDKGEIQLSIDHDSKISCFVKILYFDKVNGGIINAKAKDDL
jgi:hypothetical protein